jgi:hypothetical protein
MVKYTTSTAEEAGSHPFDGGRRLLRKTRKTIFTFVLKIDFRKISEVDFNRKSAIGSLFNTLGNR